MKDLKATFKDVVKQGLQAGGAALGSQMGPSGAIFGRELGSKISKLIGSGDYESNLAANDLIKPMKLAPSASFAGTNGDFVRIRRREFLADILTSAVAGEFVNYTYPINAGLFSSFPFLSRVAANYEEFCFDGLVFEFISSASPYVAGSALGTVIASMEYNSAIPSFGSKFTMENSAHAISARLDHSLMYGVECEKGSNVQNCYYVRTGASTLPLTTTDLGKFQIALAPSTSVPASTVVGELWVTYDVVLKRPYLTGGSGVWHRWAGAASNLLPLGTNTIVNSNIGAINFSTSSGTTLNFANAAVGDIYVVTWIYTGTVAAAYTAPVLTYSGCAAYIAFNGDTTANLTVPSALANSTVVSITFAFQAQAQNGSVTFGAAGTLPTGSIQVEMVGTYIGNTLTAAAW